MTDRDYARLAGVHPDLIAALTVVLAAMALAGTPMFVVQGVRTVQQQQALYAQGRTLPGHIVTQRDGIKRKSNHQPHEDGLGHAVDCAFIGPGPFADTHPWDQYGTLCEAQGLTWGGRWVGLVDRPHVELP